MVKEKRESAGKSKRKGAPTSTLSPSRKGRSSAIKKKINRNKGKKVVEKSGAVRKAKPSIGDIFAAGKSKKKAAAEQKEREEAEERQRKEAEQRKMRLAQAKARNSMGMSSMLGLDGGRSRTCRPDGKPCAKGCPACDAFRLAGKAGVSPAPPVHRVDRASGMPVYKIAALGMNQVSGGTPDCPFDCWCCF